MFGKKITTPTGFEAYVNSNFIDKRVFHISKNDNLHFVNFNPYQLTFMVQEIASSEDIIHNVILDVRFNLIHEKLNQIIKLSGSSNSTNPVKITVKDLVEREFVVNKFQSIIKSYVSGCGFFELKDNQKVLDFLQQKCSKDCNQIGLDIEVLMVNVSHIEPDETLLSKLSALANLKGNDKPELNYLVNFFIDSKREKQKLIVELEIQKESSVLAQIEEMRSIDEQKRILEQQKEIHKMNLKEQTAVHAQTILDAENERMILIQKKNFDLQCKNSDYERELELRRTKNTEMIKKSKIELETQNEELQHALNIERNKHENELEHQKVLLEKEKKEFELDILKKELEFEIEKKTRINSIEMESEKVKAQLAEQQIKHISEIFGKVSLVPDYSKVHNLNIYGTNSDPMNSIYQLINFLKDTFLPKLNLESDNLVIE